MSFYVVSERYIMTTTGEIVRERALSSKKELHQAFVEEGKERRRRWSVEIRGFGRAEGDKRWLCPSRTSASLPSNQ